MTQVTKYAEMIITLEEGFSAYEYYCTQGYVTVGFGRKISDDKSLKLSSNRVNRKDEILFVRKYIDEVVIKLSSTYPIAWSKCNQQRQAILISMTYQLGFTGVSKFKKMWSAIEMSNFEEASRQMLDSLWARQTKNRALRHAKTMKDGTLDMYYLSKGAFN